MILTGSARMERHDGRPVPVRPVREDSISGLLVLTADPMRDARRANALPDLEAAPPVVRRRRSPGGGGRRLRSAIVALRRRVSVALRFSPSPVD